MYDQEVDGIRQIEIVNSTLAIKPSLDQYTASDLVRDNTSYVLVIEAFATADDFYLAYRKPATSFSFGEWKSKFSASIPKSAATIRMSRFTKIGNNYCVDYIFEGKVYHFFGGEHDPREIKLGVYEVKILQIQSLNLPYPIQSNHTKAPRVWINVESLPIPTLPGAAMITRYLAKELRQSNVRTFIREDTWFIEDTRFPIWYPFSKLNRIPTTVEEYRGRPQVFCKHPDPRNVQCSITHYR